MPIYSFQAYGLRGKKVSGQMDARDERELDRRLRRMGMDLIAARPQQSTQPSGIMDALLEFEARTEALVKKTLSEKATATPHYNRHDFQHTRKQREDIRARIVPGATDSMPTFLYVAKSVDGHRIKGEMEAADVTDLAYRLQAMGMTFIKLRDEITDARYKKTTFRTRLPGKEIIVLCHLFSQYFQIGFPPLDMLDSIRMASGSPKIKALLWRVRQDVAAGKTISEAMSLHSKAFGRFFMSMVDVSEATGKFTMVMDYAGAHLKKMEDIRREWIIFLRIPGFTLFFTTMLAALAGGWYIHLWIGFIPVLAYYCIRLLRQSSPRCTLWMDRLFLKIPRLGDCITYYDTAGFTYLLGTMWQAGLTIEESLHRGKKIMHNMALRESIEDIEAAIRRGDTLSAAIQRSRLFPPLVLNAVHVGDTTGRYDLSLDQVYHFYIRAIQDASYGLLERVRLVILSISGLMVLSLAKSTYPTNH